MSPDSINQIGINGSTAVDEGVVMTSSRKRRVHTEKKRVKIKEGGVSL